MKNTIRSITFTSTLVILFFLFSACAGSPDRPSPARNRDGTAVKIALFPFENFSKDKDAFRQIIPALKRELGEKGVLMENEDNLTRLLLKERVRYTGYVPRDLARKIRDELQVDAILTGSIVSFSSGENPKCGLLARLIDPSDGRIVWADYASATGEDFTTILGLGKIVFVEELVPRVIDRLLASFSASPRTKEAESAYRIAVMPFLNKSGVRGAGMIATHMFVTELFKNERFIPIEYGDVRRVIVDARIMYKGELNYSFIEAFAESLGVDGILVGFVDLYSDGTNASSQLAASISARLIDAHKKRILWYDNYEVTGAKGTFILNRGEASSVDQAAYRVVSRLVREAAKVSVK